MHIKISRTLEHEEDAESNPSFKKRRGSIEEIIIPIESIALSKIRTNCPSLSLYDRTLYQVNYQAFNTHCTKTILVSKEEYDRIEKSLAFNNKKELEILANSYPEINTKNAIESLQLNED
jgi:hypothetical protein